MNPYLITLFKFSLTWFSITSLAQLSFCQQERMEFYFDYRIEYAYSTPTIPNGQIIALYNTEDKYVAFTHISPYMTDESVFIGFSDGSNIFFSKEGANGQGFIREASLPGRHLDDDKFSMDAAVFWDYIKPTGRQVDIAGYLAKEYVGQLDDYSQRTIWVSEESFDSRTLHTPFSSDLHLFPLPLVEADYITADQFLLGSDIVLENGNRYSLTVTYLEYELNKVNFSDYYIRSESQNKTLATSYNGASSLLRNSKYQAWKEFDRMGGLEYTPRQYDFDKLFHYRYTDFDGSTFNIQVYYNTIHEFCGIRSDHFGDDLDFIIGFKNGMFISYYKDKFTGALTEALFFEPSGGTLHLDQPEYIRWAQQYFDGRWVKQSGEEIIQGKSTQVYKSTSGNNETLGLAKINFDPRAAYMDYHLHIEEFPVAFIAGNLAAPGLILTRWTYISDTFGNSMTELIKEENVNFNFSDIEVPEFIRIKK